MTGPLDRLVAPLVADPRHGGIVCDIDGTLAPIAPTPERAAVIPGAVRELERLAGKYALVACVTGRRAAEARRMIPVEGVEISGNHGLEEMHGDEVSVVTQAARYIGPMHEALLLVENDGLLPGMGCWIEDKGVTFTVHFRGSPRPDHALRYLEAQIVPKLDRAGLSWRFGRMVLEVRPPVPIDKGSAIKRLRGRRHIDQLLYVGDDRTDLDAFREATIRIAVRSAEGPQELIDAADGCVDSPQHVVELLASL
ncbi:MAG: trehalose 6-phosphate phosphatase [Gaiellales bacterium]|jgi:trehalose-phosphatase|nr:trehalose 6-phosphate phosphatase [Gaiellales bacterium]MDX6593381.1 trehalose 6-phosphate phosphatase [Gaiellales bacterium]